MLRRRAEYALPAYRDPKDLRLVRIIRRAQRSAPGAVNILGAPFDGAVLGRRGAAEGPGAIRRALSFFSTYSPELGLDLAKAKVLDLGDVVVRTNDVRAAHVEIEREVARGLDNKGLLLVLGGDNSVSLPSLRAYERRFHKIGLVVVDSHFDLRGEIAGRPTSGSSYGLAIKTIRGLDPKRVAEVGIHGFLNSRRYAAEAKRLGLTIFTSREVRDQGGPRIAKRAYETASDGSDAVYLSIDLDAVDLAYVSGVSAPSAGGISANELFEMAYFLGGRDAVKCADIVELAPSLDPSGRSQIIAATALVQLVAGFTASRERD